MPKIPQIIIFYILSLNNMSDNDSEPNSSSTSTRRSRFYHLQLNRMFPSNNAHKFTFFKNLIYACFAWVYFARGYKIGQCKIWSIVLDSGVSRGDGILSIWVQTAASIQDSGIIFYFFLGPETIGQTAANFHLMSVSSGSLVSGLTIMKLSSTAFEIS